MTNPDRSTHASETCMAALTLAIILALLALTVAAVVKAY